MYHALRIFESQELSKVIKLGIEKIINESQQTLKDNSGSNFQKKCLLHLLVIVNRSGFHDAENLKIPDNKLDEQRIESSATPAF
ncbi:hypothetical protein BpHYR1_023661 [Brachionus plicatilis]|uniref:Uncharacterized protein n=1 Tax=Brachionus plicatilis TaxID=10195 RepID=A0A3M7ST90_BRAPC|nr:hypothetical protein BpHYR1_023661 [Brachionus plicatilis]